MDEHGHVVHVGGMEEHVGMVLVVIDDEALDLEERIARGTEIAQALGRGIVDGIGERDGCNHSIEQVVGEHAGGSYIAIPGAGVVVVLQAIADALIDGLGQETGLVMPIQQSFVADNLLHACVYINYLIQSSVRRQAQVYLPRESRR